MKAPKRAFVLPFVLWSLLPPGVAPVAGSPVPTTRARPAPAVQLVVDASDAPRTLFRAHEVIPARPPHPGLSQVDSGRARTDRADRQPVWPALHGRRQVLAGEYFRAIPLSKAKPAVGLDIAADSPAALAASPKFLAAMRQLVDEADALFGARHYDHYSFLLALSDRIPYSGLEHHQSSDNRVGERALIDDDVGRIALDVLTHEYVHSWNGKYRRPEGLATPDFQTPMRDELLWVYEGLTQYYGKVLAVRSGLWTPEQYRDSLAQIAASLDHTPGRAWRPLVDTAVAAQLLYGSPSEWSAERRGTDFYNEGWLIWLEVDIRIRQLTSGQHSLDDFCRRFLGRKSGPPAVEAYTLEDVVAALGDIAPYDWSGFFDQRLSSTDVHAPLGGIHRSGWRLAYDGERSQVQKDRESAFKQIEMGYSLGLRLSPAGVVGDVIPGTPAARAGLAPGMTIVAVDGRTFSPEVLRDALSAARTAAGPIRLLVDNEGSLEDHPVDDHGGEQYPHLQRDTAQPDLLTPTLKSGAKVNGTAERR